MRVYRIIFAGLIGAAVVATPLAASADVTIRMLKTWDARYPGSVVICDRFAEMLKKASGGGISVMTFGPDVVPPLNQLEPVQNGVFNVLCTYPGFHTGTTTLLAGLEGMKLDPDNFRASGAWSEVDAHYANFGVKTIAIPLAHGLTVFLRKPLSKAGDMSGMQIRALPPQHPYIKAMGATPIVLPPVEMFTALERGVVEGAIFPAAGSTGYGFPDVTGYFLTPFFNTLPHIIVANASFWKGLDEETRQTIEEQARLLEAEIPGVYTKLNDKEKALMEGKGMKAASLSESATVKLKESVKTGSWAFAGSRAADSAATLQAKLEAAKLLEK